MQEQRAGYPKRASATREELAARRTTPPANMHRTGHYAGLHSEDAPYLSGNIRQNDVAEDDSYYPQRMPSSTRRYTTTTGQQVIQQGNKRIVIHHQSPPQQLRRFHWMLFVGLALLAMVVGWIAFTLLLDWWQAKQVDWKYGNPRTFQTDHFVDHADSVDHPNHFIAINVAGTIEVVELNTTNPKNDHIYIVTTISDSTTPVTVSFADINHDGKIDMLVTIGMGSSYTVILLSDGSQFISPKP
jgi:hypothetical protein